MNKPFNGVFTITQEFGETVTDPDGHKGIDYGLYYGTPVLAAAFGTVKSTERLTTGYGNHVIIEHLSGLTTIYAHLSSISVSVGETVVAGQEIGRSGSSGNSTGPHLHFEVRSGNTAIDPHLILDHSESEPVQENREGKWQILIDRLNIRSGPGLQYPITGSLAKGDIVCGYELNEDCWLRISQNEWTAVRYGNCDYAGKIRKGRLV